MDEALGVVEGDVWIRDGDILAVAPQAPAPAQVPRFDATGLHLLPGFIQAHTHLGQALFRGLAENRPLLAWLRERVWPLEAAHDAESARASAELGLADALLSGTTTMQDMGLVTHTDALAQAVARAGTRALIGPCLMDEGPSNLATSTERALEGAVLTPPAEAEGRIVPILCPRFILSCSSDLWRGVVELAQRHALPVHTHLLEHPQESAEVRAALGVDQMTYLDELGVFDTDLRIAHAVHLGPEQARVLGTRPLKIAHCPSANLKLGSGIADLPYLQSLPGTALGIGCDGAPCNNDMDILEEMRLAALLQQLRGGPGSFPARRALEMATCEGARALGLEHRIGRIAPGLAADLVALDLHRPQTFGPEPVSVYDRVVYGAGRDAVRAVWVAGRALLRDGRLTTLDLDDVLERAARALERVLARAHLR